MTPMMADSDIRREPPTRTRNEMARETEHEPLAVGLVDLAALGDADLSRPEPYGHGETQQPDRARV
jgi:hypothetical protein